MSLWRTALRLGRVSNLPTVWTNVMAGMALNGVEPTPELVVPVGIAVSLFYVAGMFLNDAFDHRWDAVHRPERPIPAGEVQASTVFQAGFGMMGLGVLLLAAGPGGTRAAAGGLALAACIVAYNASHKTNRYGPVIMGLCRVSVYVIAALAAAPHVAPPVVVGALFLLAYLVALTSVARLETRIARVPALVGLLIAGICLLDATMLIFTGHLVPAALAVLGFYGTRRLQRRIAGT